MSEYSLRVADTRTQISVMAQKSEINRAQAEQDANRLRIQQAQEND